MIKKTVEVDVIGKIEISISIFNISQGIVFGKS